jgi:threonine dehydrogenase-like Zn-dependent dehydrogenase
MVPAEPLGCAINIMERAAVTRGSVVAIIGIGFLGALLTQLATRAGARVLALSRRQCSLAAAHRMGAAVSIPLDDPSRAVERVKDLTGGQLCDVTIEATGKQKALDLAGEITRERGRLVIAGYHQDGPRQVNMQMWNWKGLDVINAHERDPQVYIRGIRAAVDAVRTGQLQPASLYTHRFPLDQLGVALDMTRDRPDGFMKCVVMP